jgi:hypothetical protein
MEPDMIGGGLMGANMTDWLILGGQGAVKE